MPTVKTRGGKAKHFPYTKKGVAAAKTYAKQNKSRVQSKRMNG